MIHKIAILCAPAPLLLALGGQSLLASQLTIPSTVNVSAGGGMTVGVTYQRQGGPAITALQFDFLYEASQAGGLSVQGTAGAAAVQAGKTLSSAPIQGGMRFIILGVNQNVIGDGVVVNLVVQANAGAAGTYPLVLGGVVVSDATAKPVAVASSSGSITVGAYCSFSIDSTSASVASGSGSTGSSLTGSFNLTATSCNRTNTWTAVSDSPHLIVTSNSTGDGFTPTTKIGWSMFTNSSTQPRTAHIMVAGQFFTVTQDGSTETISQRVVRALYQTILGREPDSSGWYFWTSTGAPRANGAVLFNQMADGFYRSPEFRDSGFAVLSISQAVTGQLPPFNYWYTTVAQLRHGVITPAQLTDTLAASISDSAFVQAAIQNGLGRAPTASEMSTYPAQLSNSTFTSRFDFLNRVIFTDPAFQNQTNPALVKSLFFTILLRDPDTAGNTFWTGQLTNSPGMPGIYYIYLTPAASYAQKLAVIGQAVPPNPTFLGFLGSPEFQGLIQ